MPLMMSQNLLFLFSAILMGALSFHGTSARAQEDTVPDTDEVEVSTERGSDEMSCFDDELSDEVIELSLIHI